MHFSPEELIFPIFPLLFPRRSSFFPRLSKAHITTSPVEYTPHIACSVRACAFASMCQVCVCSLFKYIARAVTWRLCLLRRQTTLEPSPAARGRGRPRCMQRSGRQAQQKSGEDQHFAANRAGRPDLLQNAALNHRLALGNLFSSAHMLGFRFWSASATKKW